jgi:hypothetical protein
VRIATFNIRRVHLHVAASHAKIGGTIMVPQSDLGRCSLMSRSRYFE